MWNSRMNTNRNLTFLILTIGFSIFSGQVFANGATEVTECGFESTEAGQNLVLNQDLYASESQTCIVILDDDVTLDCQGYTITGFEGTGFGVGVSLADNVKIENCRISHFITGILLRGSYGSLVRNNESSFNAANGIQISDLGPSNPGGMNELTNNVANHNRQNGYFLGNSDQHIVSGNTGNHNRAGIRINNSNENMIIDNSFNRNAVQGMLMIAGADENLIIDNVTNRNGGAGIRFFGSSDDNVFEDNTVNKNGNGIAEAGSSFGNVFNNNVCRNNAFGDETSPEFCK